MKTGLMIASTSLILLVTSQAGLAGPCSDQISEFQKIIASSDAGSGPTMRTGSTTGSIGSGQSSTGVSSGGPAISATPSQVPQAGAAPGTEATAAMNQVTQDRATSPADVRAQIQGQPTASQSAAGAGRPSSGGERIKLVEAALDRARSADQRGDAAACMTALQEAKGMMPSR